MEWTGPSSHGTEGRSGQVGEAYYAAAINLTGVGDGGLLFKGESFPSKWKGQTDLFARYPVDRVKEKAEKKGRGPKKVCRRAT